ncbi:MAG TPA: hypothetical protein VFB81_05455 [Myxococcales bacterium]|nr:hypothetical protein [Myxococcales bacterium]
MLTRNDQGRHRHGRVRGPAALLVLLLAGGAACREPAVEPDLCSVPAPAPIGALRLTARCASAYRPPAPPGAPPADVPPLRALARLEARGDLGELAAAWFLRGNLQQAAAYLKRSPPSPDRDSDLAAVACARGQHAEALELLDSVLDRRADHPQALWNRGVVLRQMDLSLLAAESFERAAAGAGPGWSEEARARAAALRDESAGRERAWKAARDALQATIGAPPGSLPAVPVDALARFPGLSREHLYDALRTASDRRQALALLPLAEALDQASGPGSTVLRDHVQRVAAADFARRAPLAREYLELYLGKHSAPADLVARLRRAGERERDLLFGALVKAQAVQRTAGEVEALARGWDDPWLQLDAEMELARLDALAGRHEEGDRRLLEALRRCAEANLPYQCLLVHRRLSDNQTAANLLPSAEEHGRAMLRQARALGERGMENSALLALAQALRFQLQFASARAMMSEALARSPGDARMCSYVHRNLTVLALVGFRVEEARKELELALGCGPSITLIGAWAISELAWRSPAPSDAGRLALTLGQLSPNVETPGRRMLALWIRGRFELLSDRAAGEALLRQAISASEPLLATDANARDAWTRAYQDLALVAARGEDWAAAMAVMAERLRVAAPARCALGAVVVNERTAVVVRGPDGRVDGSYDSSRRAELGRSLEGLVPSRLVAMLEGCPRVDVLTTSPLDTRSGLLPPHLAWSYRVGPGREPRGGGPPPPPRTQRHLVVANVEAPASLRLARLAPWNIPGPPSGSTVTVSGAGATPSRVLSAMAEATTIDIHAHGLLNPLLSGATAVALAPEPDGRYALTAEAIGRARLHGAPVVSLAACAVAWRPALIHETFSLPQSFIEAGARAVMAATVDIPDSAGGFFSSVRERIQAGTEPAVALRDERLRRLRSDPAAGWVEDVLLYE